MALDLLPEIQRVIDFFEYFGGTASASHDDRSVTQNPSHGGLIDHDALDSGEKDFDASPIRDASFCDDPLVGDGHLRGVAFQQTDTKEDGSDEEAKEGPKIHGSTRGHTLGSHGTGKGSDQKRYSEQLEDSGDRDVPEHHNPMQLGLELDGLAWNQMLFDVTQNNSSNTVTATHPSVLGRTTTTSGSSP